MPSNKELSAEAADLAAELKLDINTEGLNNQQLADLVSDLKAKKRDGENHTQVDEVTEAAMARAAARKLKPLAPPPGAKAGAKPPFYVSPGVAITTKRGILSGDDAAAVTPEDFHRGEADFNRFLEAGHISKG